MKIISTIPIQNKIDDFTSSLKYLNKVKSLHPEAEIFLNHGDLLAFSKTLDNVDSALFRVEKDELSMREFSREIHYAYMCKIYEDIEITVEVFVEPIIPIFFFNHFKRELYFTNYQDIISRLFKKNESVIAECDTYILNWIKENQTIIKDLDYLPTRIKNLMIFS